LYTSSCSLSPSKDEVNKKTASVLAGQYWVKRVKCELKSLVDNWIDIPNDEQFLFCKFEMSAQGLIVNGFRSIWLALMHLLVISSQKHKRQQTWFQAMSNFIVGICVKPWVSVLNIVNSLVSPWWWWWMRMVEASLRQAFALLQIQFGHRYAPETYHSTGDVYSVAPSMTSLDDVYSRSR
jgi:hypothetical protein